MFTKQTRCERKQNQWMIVENKITPIVADQIDWRNEVI